MINIPINLKKKKLAQKSKLLSNLSRPRLLDSENGEEDMHVCMATTEDSTCHNILEEWIPPKLLCLSICNGKLGFVNYLRNSLHFYRFLFSIMKKI